MTKLFFGPKYDDHFLGGGDFKQVANRNDHINLSLVTGIHKFDGCAQIRTAALAKEKGWKPGDPVPIMRIPGIVFEGVDKKWMFESAEQRDEEFARLLNIQYPLVNKEVSP